MAGRARKRLPWAYYDALGWGGKRIDEAKARKIVERVGLRAANDQGDTPLTVAAVLGRAGMVRWLLDQGADVDDLAPSDHFRSPLGAAAYGKSSEVAAILIAAGADLEVCDYCGNTPLATAFVNCFIDPLPLATLLAESGAIITDRVCFLGREWNSQAFQAFLAKHAPGTPR